MANQLHPFRPQFSIAAFVKFTVVFSLILALFHASGMHQFVDWSVPESWLEPIGLALVCALTFMIRRPTSQRCPDCGGKCLPSWFGGTAPHCPRCRLRQKSPEHRLRVGFIALAVIAVLMLMLSWLVLWPFAPWIAARFGTLAHPALAMGLFVLLFGGYVGASIGRRLISAWRMSRPGQALKVARACGRDPVRETSFDGIAVASFGEDDPTPMLEDQWAVCRSRVETLFGAPVPAGRPLQILVFSRRGMFEQFCQRSLMNPGNLDGMYVPWLSRVIAVTTEVPRYRLLERERVVRTLLCYHCLDAIQAAPLPLWLQVGIACRVAGGDDADDEAMRLNRKMRAALARGTALTTAGLFHADPHALARLVRRWHDFQSFRAYTQFVFQSCSLVGFLTGPRAGDESRERFRAFVHELKPGMPQAAVFERHFGRGFEALLQEWRNSVAESGEGRHQAPPPEIGETLSNRLIPLVRDVDVKTLERVQAIRDIGRAGYLLGAGALIEVLRSDADVPAEEVMWALEAISGRSLGDDPGRWEREWLADVAGDARLLATSPG